MHADTVRPDEREDLFEQAPVPMKWVAPDGTILRANRAELDLLGYARDEYVGHRVGEFHDDRPALDELLAHLASGESFRDLPARLRGRDGSLKDVRLDGSAYRERGRARYMRCFIRDASAQRRFHLASRATEDIIWDWDLRGSRVVWAGGTPAFFGCAPEEIPLLSRDAYESWASRVHPDDLAMAEAAARAALASGVQSWEHEYRFRRADGEWARMLERAVIERDAEGRALRAVGAMQDVTRRRQSEEATTLLAAIVASSGDAIIGKRLDGTVTSWNAAAERMFGYSASEMIGRSIMTLIPEALHETERALLERIRRGERVESDDAQRIRKDGTRIDVALCVSPIRDPSGVVVGASSIKREITERKRAQEELARREERYRALVTATTSVVWTADPDGRFAEPQPSWEEYTGQSWDEHRGLGWVNALHPDDRTRVQAAWARARERGSVYGAEGRIWCHAEGEYRRFVERGAAVTDPGGAVREWIGTLTDVEDRWRVEDRLQHAERMESVGRLAGGIAHEANNQMTVVLGAAAFLLRRVRDDEDRDDLEHIRRAAERTAAITQQLLAFSRRQVLQPQIVDLNAVVTALEPIIRRALGEDSRVELRLEPDLGRVTADPGQLDQVLLNLTFNARDAMPGGGVLTIETANVVLDDAVPPGPWARLTVSDTGDGMDQTTLRHAFEPFFTTKPVGQGTGLGLSTVYGIVKQSGGLVSARSQPGHGTAFEIHLPLADAMADTAATSAPAPAAASSETILIVEDEPTVRDIIARALREQGYTVLQAADGPAALELAGRLRIPPSLIIADVVMPGMSGGRLAARLAERWPETPVLFTSGYTGFDAVSRGLLDEGRDFIQKPLDPDTLAEKVREVLDDRRGGRGSG
jgi:two-component system, cell cycle sensor histidine kinase and response regulator CckA